MPEDLYGAARLVAAVRSLYPSLPAGSLGVAAASRRQLGALHSQRRRRVAIARPVHRATVGGVLAESGNPADGEALAGCQLERFDATHHPCLGLDNDSPYPAAGGKKSMSCQALDELKQQVPLLNYLQAHDWQPTRQLSRGRWMGLCPLHSDHKPSFLVDPGKSLFYCYGCGRGGDVIRFAEIYHDVKFPQALAWLRQWRGLAPLLQQATDFYRLQLHRHGEAVAYLHQRGVRSPELIEHMRIGYAPGGGCLRAWLRQSGYPLSALRQAGLVTSLGYDAYVHRIVFPLEGNLYGRSVSASAPPHRFLPG